jgi:hypothetical protein
VEDTNLHVELSTAGYAVYYRYILAKDLRGMEGREEKGKKKKDEQEKNLILKL